MDERGRWIRVYYSVEGGHVHCRVFTPTSRHSISRGCNGTLVFGIDEWPTVLELLRQIADVSPEATS